MSSLPSVSCRSCSLPLSLVLLTDCCLVAKSCLTLCDHMHARLPCPSPSPRVYSNSCLLSQWCYLTTHPLLPPLLHLPSIFPSISVFSELALHIRWPKNWSFSNRPFSEYSGLISFRIDWFDFLAVQRTLKSLLQHHSLKALILWLSVFFMDQLSHLYMTAGKTIHSFNYMDLCCLMSLLFNMLSRFVIAFLPRSKRLLTSWRQSPSAVILEPKKIKSVTTFTLPLLFAMKWWA